MISVDEDQINRMIEVISRCYKLLRIVRRNFNRHLKGANWNFRNIDEAIGINNKLIDKNAADIIKVVETLQKLTGAKEINKELIREDLEKKKERKKEKVDYFI